MLRLLSIQTHDGLRLYGTLHKATTPKKPIIVIAHGYFSSNRIGPHRLYYEIAEKLNEEGFNIIRFDLRGMGESDGSIENVKFEDHVHDLTTVMRFFRQCFNNAPIVLIAHCIGCNISLPIIEMNPSYFKNVIFVSPYFTTVNTLSTFFTESQKEELAKVGYTYRKGIYSDATFFKGNNLFKPFVAAVKRHSNLITVISAMSDQFIPLEDIVRFYDEIATPPIIIPAADHNYLDREARKALIECICDILKGE